MWFYPENGCKRIGNGATLSVEIGIINNLIQQHETSIVREIIIKKWYMEVDICLFSNFHLSVNVLIDTRADLNCMREALVPTKYFEKTT